MKSIKIILRNQTATKAQKLHDMLTLIPEVSSEYLKIKLQTLETKEYSKCKEFYAYGRKKWPTLPSMVLQNTMKSCDENVKSYIRKCKDSHKLVKFAKSLKPSIPLRNDCFKFEYNKNTKTFNAWFKFMKVWYPLNLCEYHLKVLAEFEKLADSSIIIDRQGRLNLRLCFKTKEINQYNTSTLGIDIGIVQPIVCSDGKMLGSGRHIKHKKLEFGKKRAKTQKNKGAIYCKQARWTNDLNHKLSRELVDYALSQGATVLGLEKLKGGKLANKKFRKYTWAFADLLAKIRYKAECAGLKVVNVNPAFTSQTCSCCGLKSKDNRKTQSLFACECGFKGNADVNAAKNIYNLSIANGPNVSMAMSKASNSEVTLLQGVKSHMPQI